MRGKGAAFLPDLRYSALRCASKYRNYENRVNTGEAKNALGFMLSYQKSRTALMLQTASRLYLAKKGSGERGFSTAIFPDMIQKKTSSVWK